MRMTRVFGSPRPEPGGMAYFVRRTADDCAVIALHPDDRVEIVVDGLTLDDAEDLCARKIEAMRGAALTASQLRPPASRNRGGSRGLRNMAAGSLRSNSRAYST
jgi:hypothetical protein